jgi:hypothetical protein
MAQSSRPRGAPNNPQRRPRLVTPQQPAIDLARSTADGGWGMPGPGFDLDAWHVMERRDNQLIEQEILHGAGSSAFVYNFEIQGTPVTGVSVIGARHLAAHYGGLHHRLVAATQKTGALFTFTSYPAENMPMSVSCSVVHELEDEEDFYSAVCEMTDIKQGNRIQIERRELRYEQRRGGGWFERPHFATIAQSKAYRNAVLSLAPQDLVIRWKLEMLKLQKGEVITSDVFDEKRNQVIAFAARHAIAVDRQAVFDLTFEQISALGDAARQDLEAFVGSARAVGLVEPLAAIAGGEAGADQPARTAPQRQRTAAPPPDTDTQQQQSRSENPPRTSRRRVNFET